MSDHTAGTVICFELAEDYHAFCLDFPATHDVLDWSGEQCTFRKIVAESSHGMFANTGHEIGRELFGVVSRRISPGIHISGGEIRIMSLGRVKFQLEPLMPFLRIFDLKAPFVICVAIIRDLSEECKQKNSTLRTVDAAGTHVGTFSLETPSMPSEVASGH